MKKPLAALLPEEITSEMSLKNKYSGKQIFSWIHKCIFDFDKMTNLPKSLREELNKKTAAVTSEIAETVPGEDGSYKFRILLKDNISIEAVLLSDRNNRKTLCISSQAGCGMGCRFCRTGLMGLKRNLEANEIVEQYLLVKSAYGDISNIVFMGMGEPLANMKNVRKAILILNNENGSGISLRRITVSTCGIIKGIKNLTENGPNVRLAFSLITADEKLRRQLVPSAKSNTLPEIKKALINFQEKTGKRITYEIVLLAGVNDSIVQAEKLAAFIPPLKVNINIIPWNSAEELDFKPPSPEKVNKITQFLKSKNIPVTQRFRRGKGINAACGQLLTE
jgi:23S rRNA (adenine2503-C2)-methyltransferase